MGQFSPQSVFADTIFSLHLVVFSTWGYNPVVEFPIKDVPQEDKKILMLIEFSEGAIGFMIDFLIRKELQEFILILFMRSSSEDCQLIKITKHYKDSKYELNKSNSKIFLSFLCHFHNLSFIFIYRPIIFKSLLS